MLTSLSRYDAIYSVQRDVITSDGDTLQQASVVDQLFSATCR